MRSTALVALTSSLALGSLGTLFGCGSHAAAPVASAPAPVAVAVADTWKPTAFTVKVSGHGRPVIFIPGLTCDGSVWDSTIAHLGGNVEAHVVSLAGFGTTPPIAAPMLPTARAELVEYIAHAHLDHPILVGHSLGGFLSYWIAETAPDAIGGIVAVDGAPFLSALLDAHATPDSMRVIAQTMSDQMGAESPAEFARGSERFLVNLITKQADRDAVYATASKSDPKTSGAAMAFLLTTDLRPDLAKITVPAMIVAASADTAERDGLVASWHAQVDAIPKHELVVVEQSRHFVMLDQPAAFFAALDRFIAPPVAK